MAAAASSVSGPRKNSVYERPSTYKPVSSAASNFGGARYRSSTLERSSNVGGVNGVLGGGGAGGGSATVGRKNSTSGLHKPFGAVAPTSPTSPTSPTTVPSLRR